MSLKERISEDVKNAMRAKERDRLGVLRLITAAIKQLHGSQSILGNFKAHMEPSVG